MCGLKLRGGRWWVMTWAGMTKNEGVARKDGRNLNLKSHLFVLMSVAVKETCHVEAPAVHLCMYTCILHSQLD